MKVKRKSTRNKNTTYKLKLHLKLRQTSINLQSARELRSKLVPLPVKGESEQQEIPAFLSQPHTYKSGESIQCYHGRKLSRRVNEPWRFKWQRYHWSRQVKYELLFKVQSANVETPLQFIFSLVSSFRVFFFQVKRLRYKMHSAFFCRRVLLKICI